MCGSRPEEYDTRNDAPMAHMGQNDQRTDQGNSRNEDVNMRNDNPLEDTSLDDQRCAEDDMKAVTDDGSGHDDTKPSAIGTEMEESS